MTESTAAQSLFETWNAPECPFTVEYRASLVQELRAAVAYGQQAFTRGGMEVGGVLLGVRTPAGISIRTWRPLDCEHANGPTLVLSERDRTELKKFLTEARTLPDLAGVEPVGWFLSHTRSDISLRESDLQLYQSFFPASTDVALVLRPGRHGAARAGFFFRNPDGSVQAEQSLLEFNIEGDSLWTSRPAERAPAVLPHLPEDPEPEPSEGPVDTASAWLQTSRDDMPAQAPQAEPQLTGKRSWRWIALPVAALLAISWLYFSRNRAVEPVDLPIDMTVSDRAGQLVVEWDHTRPELAQVRSGAITIADGAANVTLPLTADEVRLGSFTFARQSGDVRVSLHLDRTGKPMNASARFLGTPPPHRRAAPAAADAPELQRLREENAELRGEVDRAKAHADQAETVIRVLRERVDAAEAKAGKQR